MGSTRNAQTMAKRARELALKDRRERKRAKKAERNAARLVPDDAGIVESDGDERADGQPGSAGAQMVGDA
jgi:hypothetical protein